MPTDNSTRIVSNLTEFYPKLYKTVMKFDYFFLQENPPKQPHGKSLLNFSIQLFCASIALILMLTIIFIKRKKFLKGNSCWTIGLTIPFNQMRVHYGSGMFITSYILLGGHILHMITHKYFNIITGHFAFTICFVVKLLISFLFVILFYPLFAGIANRTLSFKIIGLSLSVLLIVSDTSNLCLEHFDFVNYYYDSLFILFYRSINILFATIIALSFIKLIFDKSNNEELLYKVKNEIYVQNLLKQNDLKIKKWYSNLLCKPLEEIVLTKFNFPPELFIGIFIGLYSAIYFSLNYLAKILDWTNYGIEKLNKSLIISEDIWSVFYVYFNSNDLDQSISLFIKCTVKLAVNCLLFSIFITLIVQIFNIILMLKNYHYQFKRLYKDNSKSIISISNYNPYSLLVNYLRYSGYQSVQILMAFFIQLFAIFLIIFGLVFFCLTFIFNQETNIGYFLLNLTSVTFIINLLGILQKIVIYIFFSSNNPGESMINNSRGFVIFTHICFYFNQLFGFLSGFGKILLSLIFGILNFGRLDLGYFPKHLERIDTAHKSYCGILHFKRFFHNPILRCAVDQLGKISGVPRKSKTRWFLAYTLIKNPKLKYSRVKLFQKDEVTLV